ncbi:MAG TPA: hypothetical protein VG735_08065 [Caulobacterales bacterium]|nr:hypothetical protein [Caulobacterales bacterium]
MKTLSEDAIARLASGDPVIAGAAQFEFSQTWRFWSGYGPLTINANVFTGIGARALITPIEGQVGGAADGLTLTVSALDPDIAASIEDEDYHQKPVTIWRLIFDANGVNLIYASVWLRGRVDTIEQVETIGGDATLEIAVEGPFLDMSRKGARIASDTDQRVLGGASDGTMKHISVAGQQTLYWGKRPAAAVTSLNGGVTSVSDPGPNPDYGAWLF